MELTEIMNVISTVGFPIACCCMMFFMWNKEREEHKSEILKLTEAINNNSAVMQRFIDKVS